MTYKEKLAENKKLRAEKKRKGKCTHYLCENVPDTKWDGRKWSMCKEHRNYFRDRARQVQKRRLRWQRK